MKTILKKAVAIGTTATLVYYSLYAIAIIVWREGKGDWRGGPFA